MWILRNCDGAILCVCSCFSSPISCTNCTDYKLSPDESKIFLNNLLNGYCKPFVGFFVVVLRLKPVESLNVQIFSGLGFLRPKSKSLSHLLISFRILRVCYIFMSFIEVSLHYPFPLLGSKSIRSSRSVFRQNSRSLLLYFFYFLLIFKHKRFFRGH